jgi:hypothetical protein
MLRRYRTTVVVLLRKEEYNISFNTKSRNGGTLAFYNQAVNHTNFKIFTWFAGTQKSNKQLWHVIPAPKQKSAASSVSLS